MQPLVPKRLQIETYFGCNAKCSMCYMGVSTSFKRKIGMMEWSLFKNIVDALEPFNDKIVMTDLFALGEPMLDSLLFNRINYLKKKSFKNIAISTNADLLNEQKRRTLLDTGIETVIFSIDGTTSEIHESIRKGVSFRRVRANCEKTIESRDKGNYPTRFVVRFIRQECNKKEEKGFIRFWKSKIDPDKGDMIIIYDVNTMGGSVFSKQKLIGSRISKKIESMPCRQIFERLIILNNGLVPMCCEDTPEAIYMMGNVKDSHPIDIFNSEKFRQARELHLKHFRNKYDICRECTVEYSDMSKITIGTGNKPNG